MKRGLNKRGITPVIAYALLIFFVLIIVSIIQLWPLFYPFEKTESNFVSFENLCSQVKMKVIVIGGYFGQNEIEFEITNEGKEEIDKINIKTKSGGNEVAKVIDLKMKPGSTNYYNYTNNLIDSDEFIIYPIILGTKGDGFEKKEFICIENPSRIISQEKIIEKMNDTDHDGFLDEEDNCPKDWNPEQLDIDVDGVGNVCDLDIDGDGIYNSVDNCLMDFNPNQEDSDFDSIGDVCDLDINRVGCDLIEPFLINQTIFDNLLLDKYVYLPECSIVQLDGRPTKILSDTVITTDPKNPATIVLGRSSIYGLTIHGENIEISNVRMDFKNGPTWRPFIAMISMKHPGYLGDPANSIQNVTIKNIEFIDSDPPLERGRGDNWYISLSHLTSTPLKDIRILNNRHITRKWAQLTGNGGGTDIEGLLIADNIIKDGEANSIAVSSVNHQRIFKDITFRGNNIMNTVSTGIFIGTDGSSNSSSEIHMENICIIDNFISLASNQRGNFPHGVYVRATGGAENFKIRNNIFEISEAIAAGKSPRSWTIGGSGGGVVNVGNNSYLGGENTILNGDLTVADLGSDLSDCYMG